MMACGISFVWLNVFLKIYSHEALQENIEGATGEINGETFTTTIKAPERGEGMICVKGRDRVLKYVFLVKNKRIRSQGSKFSCVSGFVGYENSLHLKIFHFKSKLEMSTF